MLYLFWSLYSDGPLSSRPQPLGGVGDDTPCEDTREDSGLSVFLPVHHVLLQGGFFFLLCRQDPLA